MDRKTCGNCGRRAEEGETFNHCSRCKVVPYCSKACQVHHWKNGHKQACQDAQEREEEQFVAEKLAAGTSKAQRPSNETPQEPRNSPGRGAAAEEEEQKSKPPRQGGPRLDAEGKELSFGENENCGICLDKLRIPVKLLCGHWYCKECIEGVRQRKPLPDSCPLCRESLPRRGADQLFDEVAEVHTLAEGSGYRPWGCLGLRPDL